VKGGFLLGSRILRNIDRGALGIGLESGGRRGRIRGMGGWLGGISLIGRC